jgi:hypothetical protein
MIGTLDLRYRTRCHGEGLAMDYADGVAARRVATAGFRPD